jgi:flagellar biosynthetic protein FlhB
MADQQGEPTEKATAHRLREAREQGNVPKSQDVTSMAMIAVLAGALLALGVDGVHRLAAFQVTLLSRFDTGDWSSEGAAAILLGVLLDALLLLGPLFLALVVTALVANLAQTGLVFTTKPFGPDFNRMNPATGLKKIWSLKGLFDVAKGSVKLALLLTVTYFWIKHALPGLLAIAERNPKGYLALLVGLCGQLLVKLAAVLLVLAACDFAFVRWHYHRDLRMSKQEIKDEYKKREGDPRIHGRMRDIRRDMLKRSSAMGNVHTADVIITNPTHIAVALGYEHGVSPAPRLIAKGAGDVAKQIRSIAGRHHIPVVQNPPLARALYRELDIEAYVPEKWFPQVAKILIWVYAMRKSQPNKAEE